MTLPTCMLSLSIFDNNANLKIISQNIQNIHANKYQTAGQFLIFYELIEMLQRKLYIKLKSF